MQVLPAHPVARSVVTPRIARCMAASRSSPDAAASPAAPKRRGRPRKKQPQNGSVPQTDAVQASTDPEDLMAQVEALRAENESVQREIAQAAASPAAKRRSGAAAVAPSEASAPAEAPPSAATGLSTQAAVREAPSLAPSSSPSLDFLEFQPPAQDVEHVSTPAPRAEQASNGVARQAAPAARPPVEQAETPRDVVFVSSEVAPWSKTGGLGDVVGSLPMALSRRGHRVMVISPRYLNGTKADDLFAAAEDLEQKVWVDMGACGWQEVAFFHLHRDGVDWVFVDHPSYQRPGGIYADTSGTFGDNQFRFALLSLAACEAPLVLNIGGYRSGSPPGFPYGDRCVFLANDWHASLVPVYLAAKYRRNGVYKDARTILAIHNLSHQGVDPAATFANLGLPDDIYDPMGWEYPSWAHINGPAVNLLKGGILTADRVMTVSKGYAWEITTSEGGWGLDQVLKSRQHVLDGIANGIDMDEWDPATDSHLEQNYSASNLAGKAACKAALQRELGLPEDASVPLLGFIGRLDFQKGPDVVLEAVGDLAARGLQTVMLGSGMDEYESAMRGLEAAHPAHFRGWVGFSIPVAHRIVAGCDILLMPSRFEPCGLNQLFSMRYGTVPVAHATGGLRDTIANYDPNASDAKERGSGFTFGPPQPNAMLQAVDHAVHVFRGDRAAWQIIQKNGMEQDLSWEKAAKQYEQLFDWAMMDEAVRPW